MADREDLPPLWPDLVDSDFLHGLREAVATHVTPDAERIDREDVYPVEAIKALARLGYTSLTLPEAYGGQAAGALAQARPRRSRS